MQHLYYASVTLKVFVMPSQRKRIGFLPSEEIHEIIEKLCTANAYSQSKVTGLLVEEALRSRGILSDSFPSRSRDKIKLINDIFEKELLSKNNKSFDSSNYYAVSNKAFSDDIKLMHEFIEFKYFKKVMKQNKDILE